MNSNDYWSIDSILAEQQTIKAITITDISDYGYLSEERDKDLKQNQKIKLPLWLAKELHVNGKISIIIPAYLTKKYWDILKADPTIVNLKNKTNYFYDTLFKLGSLIKSEHIKTIVPTILNTFTERLKMILSKSESSYTNLESEKLKRKLSSLEDKIFEANKYRATEVLNFKQQIESNKNYGIEDIMFKRQTKRIRNMQI